MKTDPKSIPKPRPLALRYKPRGGGGVGGWLMVVVVVANSPHSLSSTPDPALVPGPADPTPALIQTPTPTRISTRPHTMKSNAFPANDFPKLFGQFPLPQGPNRGRKLVFWRNCELTDQGKPQTHY